MVSTRLAVAVHVLTVLEQHAGVPVASEQLARSVRTHPTAIRRLLGVLAAAELTSSQLGAGGGALLARPGRAITLLDVYRAVESTEIFAFARVEPDAECDAECDVGRNVVAALTPHFDAAARALERELARTTIADVLRDIGREELRRRRRAVRVAGRG